MRIAVLSLTIALFWFCVQPYGQIRSVRNFSNPHHVTLSGYSGDAMEPFLSRDGKYLFFNNRNDAGTNTDLFWAERIDDLTFKFRGSIEGVNTAALEGVPSMSVDGTFYFISPRSYDRTASTIHRGRFANGKITGVELVPGVSRAKPGIVQFDAEISADGMTLYFVESQFSIFGRPKTAEILYAQETADGFNRVADSARVMRSVNSEGLNYAPAISPSGLEIFFTRAGLNGPSIYTAVRANTGLPFETPRRIEAITGFAEGPTISPDGDSLYYHKKEGDRFVLYRVTRERVPLP